MNLVSKMVRAAKLDVNLYEEVEADTGAMPQAMLVVILASLAGGIGVGIKAGAGGFLTSLTIGTMASLMSWFVWALLTYLIGTTVLKGPETKATLGQLLRTIGFAASPGVLNIFGFIPILGTPLLLVTAVWSLVAMIIAVRQALDFSTGRAIGTCVVGWIIQGIVIFLMMGGIPKG